VVPFEKECFDSLPLGPMGLYLNLLGRFVACWQPFGLVYR
jgi:hypothetical protein